MPQRPEWSRARTRPASIKNRRINSYHQSQTQTRQIPKRQRLTSGEETRIGRSHKHTTSNSTVKNKHKWVTSGEKIEVGARSDGSRRSNQRTYLTGSNRTEDKHFGEAKEAEEWQHSSGFRGSGNHRNWSGIRRMRAIRRWSTTGSGGEKWCFLI